MDVRCNRCATEYEFDDALISERGTTVKCTNCGYQFKIFPREGKGLAPERWVVRTASGRELVYTSLRELQRGIADKKVGTNDLLSRGKQAPRPLGSIPELEPFFQVLASSTPKDALRAQRTLHGVAPQASSLGFQRNAYSAAPSQVPATESADARAAAPTPAAPVSATVETQVPVASASVPLPRAQLLEPTPTPVAVATLPEIEVGPRDRAPALLESG